MEEDILDYSPTVMFRGTPCILNSKTLTIWQFLNNQIIFKTIQWEILEQIMFSVFSPYKVQDQRNNNPIKLKKYDLKKLLTGIIVTSKMNDPEGGIRFNGENVNFCQLKFLFKILYLFISPGLLYCEKHIRQLWNTSAMYTVQYNVKCTA